MLWAIDLPKMVKHKIGHSFMVWQTGQSLYGGRYRVARVLGQGGFGIAYLAHDQKGRPVVIKTLKDDVLLDKKIAIFAIASRMRH